ncbi:YdcF family protein [Trichocoleus sp. ST-U3]
MFDSKLCDRWLTNTFTRLPLITDWSQFGWRKQLLLVIIVILAFFGLRWIRQHKRWRRWLSSPRVVFLLFGITATVPIAFALAAKGLVVFLPTDSGAAAEAIVVLGRSEEFRRERVDVARELWQARRAPMIFTSGRGDAANMIEQLKAKGIPNQVLDGENCSLTTWQNAVFTAAVLHPQGIRRILLVTDELHMLRSLLVFRAHGFTVIPHTTPLPPNFGFKATAFLTFREYLGLVAYGLQGRFHPQRSPESNSPDIENIRQKAEQYGQQQRLQEEDVYQEK